MVSTERLEFLSGQWYHCIELLWNSFFYPFWNPLQNPFPHPHIWCMDLIFGFSFVVSLAQQSLSYILTRDTQVKLSYTCLMGYAQQFCSSVKCSIYAGFFISIAHSFSYPAVYKFPDFAFSFFSVFLAFCRLSFVCEYIKCLVFFIEYIFSSWSVALGMLCCS